MLELGRCADPTALGEIDVALRAPDGIGAALNALGSALRGRCVVVEHVEQFASLAGDEIANAVRARRHALVDWILDRADLVTSDSPVAQWTGAVRQVSTSDAVAALRNGAAQPPSIPWSEVGRNEVFTLALQLQAVESDDDEDEPPLRTWDPEALRSRLWEALPETTSTLLGHIAVFGRPLPVRLIERLPCFDRDALNRGSELALWRRRGDEVVPANGWTDWCYRARPSEELRSTRRTLAETFATEVRPDDPSASRAGLTLLDTFRLFVELGDVERALPFARHGIELLAGHARDLSRNHRYADAARVYERIAGSALPMPQRLRGYVKHYLHFNRAHARPELEPVLETARGYDEALRDWPQNAIFASRTVRAWFLAGHAERARDCLHESLSRVPPHPDKRGRLVARTARRLAELGHPVYAMEVLGDFQPGTEHAADDLRRLAKVLADGWYASRIELTDHCPLVLHRPERFRMVQQGGQWRLMADRLGYSARCATPIACVGDFVRALSDEVRALSRAFDRDLDDDARDRKRTLLGAVDVIASGLDAPSSATTWVMGHLEREANGSLWLIAPQNVHARYEVPPALAESLTVGDTGWLAEVTAGPSGVPQGPVIQLESLPSSDRDDVWRRWRERLSE
ncbi:MAG: hypothetical protein R3A48_22020 [Polyangiales bacterium]